MAISVSEFADRLNEIMPVLMREFTRRHSDELSEGKITLPQFLLLNFLSTEGEACMTDLASFMKVTTAAVTGCVSRLVRCGYISRFYDERDRRLVKVRLTVKGRELIARMAAEKRKTIMNIFGKISAGERQDYLRILTRIRDILIKEGAQKA